MRGIRRILRTLIPLSAAALVAAACGGGGGSPQTVSMPMPMPMPPPCVQTHDRGCVAEADYDALSAQIAGEHARAESFEHQWGLAAIGADRAYANLELKLGPDAAPGEGVIVGVLDTGIDGAHPAFEHTKVSERLLEGAESHESSHRFSLKVATDSHECSHPFSAK